MSKQQNNSHPRRRVKLLPADDLRWQMVSSLRGDSHDCPKAMLQMVPVKENSVTEYKLSLVTADAVTPSTFSRICKKYIILLFPLEKIMQIGGPPPQFTVLENGD